MEALVGLLIKAAFMVFGLLLKILFKLRLLPAFLFVLITQIWFGAWAHSIGDWYETITIALIAIGLGSFVVQGIIKLRSHLVSSKIEKEYEARLEAKREQEIIDELYRSGRLTRINFNSSH